MESDTATFYDKTNIIFYSFAKYEHKYYEHYEQVLGYKFRFVENNLTEDTAVFAFGCKAVVIYPTDIITPAIIDELVRCGVKLIVCRSAGYDHVDLEYAKGKISVSRVPAYSPDAIAEYVFSLLLSLSRGTHHAYQRTRNYIFTIDGLVGFNLSGKSIGVVGEGKIGSLVIRIAQGFGMRPIVYTRHPKNTPGITYVTLEELFRQSDIISLNCPLTDTTYHMVNKDTLALMKPDAILINTARGALIDTQSLIEALKNYKIGAVGMDVYEGENTIFWKDLEDIAVQDDNIVRLLSFPNVIITSHQAFLTDEAVTAIAGTVMENIRVFVETGVSPNALC